MEKGAKADLATAIVAAVAGVAIAFVVTNIFIPELENVSFKTLGSGVSSSLTQPDEEVFNYRAVNPTVEVYVGEEEETPPEEEAELVPEDEEASSGDENNG